MTLRHFPYVFALALLGTACSSSDKPPAAAKSDAGRAGAAGASGRSGASGSAAGAGSGGATAGSGDKPASAGKSGSVAAGASGSASAGRAGAAGNAGRGDAAAGSGGMAGAAGAGAGAAAPCDNSVCNANYPCRVSGSAYECRGQFADWPPAYAPAKFKVNADDTVTDSRSGLVWQRTLPATYAGCNAKLSSTGMAGEACTSAHAKAYCTALSLAGSGWRLPTKAELESLIDDSRYNPAIDTTAFPATAPEPFWTASPMVGGTASYVWFIDFDTGMSAGLDGSNAHRVRCVR